MAKNCITCGKKIGVLGVRVPLLGTEDLVICSDCFDKMPTVLEDLYQKRIYPTKDELLTVKDEVIRQLKDNNYNQDTVNVVTKFLDDKIARAKTPQNKEDGKVLKKCPICKKHVNYDSEICSDCGFAFSVVDVIEYQEIAKIYNNRWEQIKKNPFYEYDYVVVNNLPDGSTDKVRIDEIISRHAMKGWRLVTMYSNELGKNSVGGAIGGIGGVTNSTMCEDVMVFERCIKAGEK